jgi:uncharacterized protein (TIGR03437 family)
MTPTLLRFLCLGLGASLAFGQLTVSDLPRIREYGAVNGASYTVSSLPGGGLPQGTIFTLFGANLGPQVAPDGPHVYPLPATWAGVSIKVLPGTTGQGNALDAYPFYVSATQISAILPSAAPLGPNRLVVTYNGKSSAEFAITVIPSSLGLIAINSGGFGPSVVQNYFPDKLPVNSRTQTAKPGQIVIAYGTGLAAALNADKDAPTAGNLPVKVEIWVGGKSTAANYAGRTPCCSGLDQIAFNIPNDAPLGCYVPVVIRTGGVAANVVTLAISADGGPCADDATPLGDMTSAGTRGNIDLIRASFKFSDALSPFTFDLAAAWFLKYTGGDFAFSTLGSLPPAGTCSGMTAVNDVFGGFFPAGSFPSQPLNAGVVTINNGSTSFQLPREPYYSLLANSNTVPGAVPGSFLGGNITVGATGGTTVGAFQAIVPPGPILTWSNRDQTSTIDRTTKLAVNWTLSGTGSTALTDKIVVVIGGEYDAPSKRTSLFECVAAAADGTLSVPDYILSRLPASRDSLFTSRGVMLVGVMSKKPPVTFSAKNLDGGVAEFMSFSGRIVNFK